MSAQAKKWGNHAPLPTVGHTLRRPTDPDLRAYPDIYCGVQCVYPGMMWRYECWWIAGVYTAICCCILRHKDMQGGLQEGWPA